MEPGTREFPCTSCGAKVQFAPGTASLVCPHCGSKTEVEAEVAIVQEHSFAEGIRAAKRVLPSELSAGGQEVSCEGCGAVSVVAGQAGRCAFCDSPVVLRQNPEPLMAPETLLPFGITQDVANSSYRKWLASRWFAPNDLIIRAVRHGMDGIYLPYWTYDARTVTRYVGQRGEHYWDEETYMEKGQRKTRKVRKTRWYPAAGTVDVPFDDVLVCASKGLPQPLAQGLEPWDLPALVPYNPNYLAGFSAERYSVDLEEGFKVAKSRMEPVIQSAIRRDIGGDEQRIVTMNVNYHGVTFKHLLLPVWLSSYRYQEKVFRFLVNARTGAVSGERPWSWIKITLAVLAVLVIIGIIVALSQSGQAPRRH